MATGTYEYASEVTETNRAIVFVLVSRVSFFRQVFAILYFFFLVLGSEFNITLLRRFDWNLLLLITVIFFVIGSTF